MFEGNCQGNGTASVIRIESWKAAGLNENVICQVGVWQELFAIRDRILRVGLTSILK